MKKKIVNSIVILIVIALVGAVFLIKQSGSGNMASMQASIDDNASREQSSRTPLEIASFSPEMIKTNEKPLIIVMGESWCQPCLRMMPDLTELSRTVDDVDIRYLDLGKNEAAFQYFPIRVTPTIAVFMPDGVPFTPPEDSEIEYILYTYKDSGEHALTIHEGYLTKSQLETIIEDLKDA